MSSTAHARWEAAVGTEYRATDEAGRTHLLRLDICTPLTVSGGWGSFTLTFTTDASGHPEQGTYLLELADGSQEALFVVPSAPRGDVQPLDAVFTQQSEATE